MLTALTALSQPLPSIPAISAAGAVVEEEIEEEEADLAHYVDALEEDNIFEELEEETHTAGEPTSRRRKSLPRGTLIG